METWLLLTFLGAFLQNIRSFLQRRITDKLSINGSSFVRFLFAIPLAILLVLLLVDRIPSLPWTFLGYVIAGGVAQIIGTSCLISAVVKGNFSVGTTLSKTEAAQAALFGLVVLGDAITASIALGILVSLAGVACLSWSQGSFLSNLSRRSLFLGLISGTGFAVAAVCFRGASLSLEFGEFFERAALTVLVAVSLQSIIMGVYLLVREPGELARVFQNWRISSVIGCVGMLASLCWFSAMTLNSAAIVRAVGQIELLFTLLTTIWLFKERLRIVQLLGMVLIVTGIWFLI
ncbi:MAG: DMT family transporter [Candidatus Azotimanducaceae bacterium]